MEFEIRIPITLSFKTDTSIANQVDLVARSLGLSKSELLRLGVALALALHECVYKDPEKVDTVRRLALSDPIVVKNMLLMDGKRLLRYLYGV